MSLIDWFFEPAHVAREVNYLYFLVVLAITLTVFGFAWYTKNKRALKMFGFAMIVWALIEGFGLVTGMRTYNPPEDVIPVFVFVALVEDPGWVCLGYLFAEFCYKKLGFQGKKGVQKRESAT